MHEPRARSKAPGNMNVVTTSGAGSHGAEALYGDEDGTMPTFDFDAIIAGAGAAGLMAAIRTAERGRRVLLLEKGKKPGVKILMSGGTRCEAILRFLSSVNGSLFVLVDGLPAKERGDLLGKQFVPVLIAIPANQLHDVHGRFPRRINCVIASPVSLRHDDYDPRRVRSVAEILRTGLHKFG